MIAHFQAATYCNFCRKKVPYDALFAAQLQQLFVQTDIRFGQSNVCIYVFFSRADLAENGLPVRSVQDGVSQEVHGEMPGSDAV